VNLVAEELAGDCGGASPCSLNLTDYTKDCCAGGCSNVPSGACFPCSNITGKGSVGAFSDPINLALLKAQLEVALQEVEIRSKIVEERLRPQTAEQVSALEQELTSALEELKTLKATLPSEKQLHKK
jgi:hypothetical protein